MKLFATGLLVLMAGVYFLALIWEQEIPSLVWVKSFAEAALVGGLADWFAVTALFRHPLGIPIPHTAIIPAERKRVGEGLGRFIQTNFLAPDTVAAKLDSLNAAGRISAWLSEPTNAENLAEHLGRLAPSVLSAIDDADAQRFVDSNLRALIANIEASPFVGHILNVMLSGDKCDDVFDVLLDLMDTEVSSQKDFLKTTIRKEVPWYVPGFIHDHIFEGVVHNVEDRIHAVRDDTKHPLRAKFRNQVTELVEKLLHSPEYLERGERLKTNLLESEIPARYLSRVWNEIRISVEIDLESEDSKIADTLAQIGSAFGSRLASDHAFRNKVNSAIKAIALRCASAYGSSLAAFIAETVSRWDQETIAEKIELHVGKDLQYIRLNGTLVGGIAGVVIHAIAIFISGR